MKRWLCFIILSIVSLTAFSQKEPDLNKRCRELFNGANYDMILNIYDAAQKEDYYDIESVQRYVCLVYYIRGDEDMAYSLAQSLTDEDEMSPMTELTRMVCMAKKGEKNDKAVAEAAENIYNSGKLPKTLLFDMNVFLRKDLASVSKSLQRYIAAEEPDKEDLIQYNTILTLLYYKEEKYIDAYNASMNILSEDNDAVIYYIIGILKKKRMEYVSAERFFTQAISSGYNSYDAYLQRAECKGECREYDLSNLDLDTCLMIDSNYYPFYLKGINYNYLSMYDDALNAFKYSLYFNDSFPSTYNYRGIVYSKTHQYEFARLDFLQALAFDNNTPFAHNNLGICYEKLGYIQQAVDEYKISTELEPRFFDAYYNLGRICTYIRETKKGIKYLETALKLQDDVPDIYYLLAINLARKGKKQDACAYLQKALEMNHTMAQEKIDAYCNNPRAYDIDFRAEDVKATPKDNAQEDYPENTSEDTETDSYLTE